MAGTNRATLRGDGSDKSFLGGIDHAFLESNSGQYRAGVFGGTFGVIRREANGQWADEMEVWGGAIDKVWLHEDGNLVARVLDGTGVAESDTHQDHATLWMQDDGNLVVYGPRGQAQWSSREGTLSNGAFADLSKIATGAYELAKEVPGVSVVVAPFEAVASFGGAIVNGDNIVDAVKAGYSDLKEGVTDFANSPLSQVAVSYVANVPGFGTIAGAGLSALIAVAQGKSLTDVGLAAIKGALPGQPLSGQLFDAGLALAKGENVLKTALSFGVAQGGAYLSSAAAGYTSSLFTSLGSNGLALPKLELPGGASLPIGVKDIVNLGASAYNQLREKVPGDARAKSAFDLAVQLSAASPNPQIVEDTRQSLQGDQKQAFELGMALHAGVTVGKVAMATGAPQPALSKAVSQLQTRTTARKYGPFVAGLGAVAVAAAVVL